MLDHNAINRRAGTTFVVRILHNPEGTYINVSPNLSYSVESETRIICGGEFRAMYRAKRERAKLAIKRAAMVVQAQPEKRKYVITGGERSRCIGAQGNLTVKGRDSDGYVSLDQQVCQCKECRRVRGLRVAEYIRRYEGGEAYEVNRDNAPEVAPLSMVVEAAETLFYFSVISPAKLALLEKNPLDNYGLTE